MRIFKLYSCIFLIFLLQSCAHTKKVQLENVAKDWCMVIRASQVIPVYPLTEDLQAGDIFLVQVPIEQQQDIYKTKGFLPLDNMVCRLHPSGYSKFYEKSFGVGGTDKELPKFWLEPGKQTAWSAAPDAAFPTYNFTVRRGAGFSLALPVQGVPVGLSLLASDAANGSIAIADARTYGVDTVSLQDDVTKWADNNRQFLARYESTQTTRNYLRIISRVYLTGKLNITLEDAGTTSAAASGGAAKPVELLLPGTGKDPASVTIEQYSKNIEKLNEMIGNVLAPKDAGVQKLLPGGTVKVAAASARSITLVEEFSRPLVVGYLGFDMLIDRGGALGPPFPTHAVIVEGLNPTGFTPVQRNIRQLLRKVNSADDPQSIRSRVTAQLKGEVETIYNMYCARDDSSGRRADVFTALMTLYLADEPDDGPRHQRLEAALAEALKQGN